MYQFFLSFFISLVLFTSIVYAEEATTSESSSAEIINPLPTPKNLTSEPVLSITAQSRLTNLTANMSNRMDATNSRLQNVADRLASRLQKMSDAGMDVSKAQSSLNAAKGHLDSAQKNMSNIDTEVTAFVGSTHPRDYWSDLKFIYISTKDDLTAAHTEILTTITLAQAAETLITPNSSTSTNLE
jgi:hypothetical protein